MSFCRIGEETKGICFSVVLSLKWPLSLNNSPFFYPSDILISQTHARPAGFTLSGRSRVQNVNASGALTCCQGWKLTFMWPIGLLCPGFPCRMWTCAQEHIHQESLCKMVSYFVLVSFEKWWSGRSKSNFRPLHALTQTWVYKSCQIVLVSSCLSL